MCVCVWDDNGDNTVILCWSLQENFVFNFLQTTGSAIYRQGLFSYRIFSLRCRGFFISCVCVLGAQKLQGVYFYLKWESSPHHIFNSLLLSLHPRFPTSSPHEHTHTHTHVCLHRFALEPNFRPRKMNNRPCNETMNLITLIQPVPIFCLMSSSKRYWIRCYCRQNIRHEGQMNAVEQTVGQET